MRAIHTRGKIVDIPTNIDELTPEQYEYYCFLSVALASCTIDLQQFRIRWFSYLIGFNRANYTILRPDYVAELRAQESAIDGFFVEDDGHYHLDFDTTTNLLPTYRGYNGPGNWLEGMTYGQFVDCWSIIEGMRNATEQEMYQGYEQIARRLYDIPASDRVPDLLIFHAPRLFSNVWRAIQTGPIEINGRKIDFRIIFKSSGPSRPDDKTGWAGITFEVAGANVFGNVKDVEETEFWAVLMYLYKCKFEYNHDKHSNNGTIREN
jgi:hypothetical protein